MTTPLPPPIAASGDNSPVDSSAPFSGSGSTVTSTDNGGDQATGGYQNWTAWEIEAAILGADLAANDGGGTSPPDPTTLWNAGNMLLYAQEMLTMVSKSIRDQANALASGDDAPWKGDAADAFKVMMGNFADGVNAQAVVLQGSPDPGQLGGAIGQSVPDALVSAGNSLAMSQAAVKDIDDWYARQQLLISGSENSNGTVTLNPAVAEYMRRDLLTYALNPLVQNYQGAMPVLSQAPTPVPLPTPDPSGGDNGNGNGNGGPDLSGIGPDLTNLGNGINGLGDGIGKDFSGIGGGISGLGDGIGKDLTGIGGGISSLGDGIGKDLTGIGLPGPLPPLPGPADTTEPDPFPGLGEPGAAGPDPFPGDPALDLGAAGGLPGLNGGAADGAGVPGLPGLGTDGIGGVSGLPGVGRRAPTCPGCPGRARSRRSCPAWAALASGRSRARRTGQTRPAC